jgi:hypothetical protein
MTTATLEAEEEKEDKPNEFTFAELSDRAKERACADYAESMYQDWPEHTLDDWKERLGELGFDDVAIQYSGFSSQGDGAGFSSRFHFEGEAALALLGDADRKSLMGMVVEVRFLCPDEKLVIWVSGRTSCGDRYYSTSVELTDTSLDYDYGGVPETAPEELRERLDSFGRAMVEAIEERVRDLDHQIFTDLEEEYEYQTSEKNVQELSEANEWLYGENGSLI